MTTTLTEHNHRLPGSTQLDLPHVTVLVDRCAGCQECVVRCPTAALSMDTSAWVVLADDQACVGCRQCERTCPFSAIQVTGPVLAGSRVGTQIHHPVPLDGDTHEVRLGLDSPDAALAEAQRCLACPDPTCVRGCPAHNDIPGFIAAIADGDLDRAHRVLRTTTMLPDVCSRVCDQAVQCEGACSWSLAGARPVAIGLLERYVTDTAPVPGPQVPAAAAGPDGSAGPDIGIIGSGPAGIAAAWELVEAGARVTVYERDDQPGGLLRWGIPDFTLPAAVASRPWEQLSDAGVELRCGTEISPGDLDDLRARHDGLVLAYGAVAPMRLPVSGADLPGVWDATSFLVAAHAALGAGRPLAALAAVPHGGQTRPAQVLVVGAGNTAMDVARSTRRLGAHAVCVDWMDPRFAPVRPDELAEAQEEGVDIRFQTTVSELTEADAGRICATLRATRQDRADRLPHVVDGAPTELEADLVVMAMGYRVDPAMAAAAPGTPLRASAPDFPDRRWIASGLRPELTPSFARHLPVGRLALVREARLDAAAQARQPGVYLAGDGLVGPSTVVEAMAQGRRAAHHLLADLAGR
ncbi:MAG: FAD-dependent oxidoreductase [Actinomycetes bacterium]